LGLFRRYWSHAQHGQGSWRAGTLLSPGECKAIISIPYSRVHTIAAEDESGLFSGRGFFSSSKLIITTSHGEHDFEFRGADKAHQAHQLILSYLL